MRNLVPPGYAFLSHVQLFHNKHGLALFLGREVMELILLHCSYELHLHLVTTCVYKDQRIMSS